MRKVIQLLDPRTAAMLATAGKSARKAARHRLDTITSKKTMAAYQAAKLGRDRYKSAKKSQNLNKIYNSLGRMGIVNEVNWYRNSIQNYINLYGNLKNISIPQKEQDRLKRKMMKWKATLANEIQKRKNNNTSWY